MKKKKIKLTEAELNLLLFSISKAMESVAPKTSIVGDLNKLFCNINEQRFS